MKVLQINSIYKKGSTGRTTFEVEKALLSRGYEPYVAYGYGNEEEDSRHFRINSPLSNNIHKILSRFTGLEGYFSHFATKRLINYIEHIKPDIIHLRCLHGDYINLPLLFKWLGSYKGQVFMNLHDCWDFTGHCPYFGKCNKWKTGCEKCLKYKEYPKSYLLDTSSKIYNDKKRWYDNINNLTVVGVSQWLCNLARQSILKNRKIECIYNWIDNEIFNPSYRKEKVGESSFTVVFVSASWNPGTYRYQMLERLLKMMPDNYKVFIAGIFSGLKIKKNNVEYLGYVSDPTKLAELYANSNVYVHLSIEEAFGKVIAEANACGIPAIVFNVSGCAELITDECCGYRVHVDDVNEILSCLETIKKNGYNYYKDGAIKNVERNFNYKTNVQKLIHLYEKSLGESKL